MFARANWCLAVVQGAIRSRVPLGFPSLAIRPMANVGGVPEFLRWSHAGAFRKCRGVPCLWAGTEPTAALVQHHAVAGQQPCTWGVLMK